MIGKFKIKQINKLSGKEEVILEEENQVTEGVKHAIVNVLTGGGSQDTDDYKFSYYQLGNQKYDLSTYDISGDLTSSSFKSYFWTLKNPLTISQYGRDSKWAVTPQNTYVLGSIYPSGLGTTKVVDNFVEPPDIRNTKNEYTNTFVIQPAGIKGSRSDANYFPTASSTWVVGCADLWSAETSNISIPPMSSYSDYTVSGPDFKVPSWRFSYTPDRYLINDNGDASFPFSCIRANFSYKYNGDTTTNLKGSLMTNFSKLKTTQTWSSYVAGIHYVSGVDSSVSCTPLTGKIQIFNRYASNLISTYAGHNRTDFLYRYDYENPDATYTPSILGVSSGWQMQELQKGNAATKFSDIYGMESESEYGVVSGNIHNRYGPVYTYADHLTGYATSSGPGADYLDTSNVGFGPSGNFYRVSVSWVSASDKMINFYKSYANGTELIGQGAVPYLVPIMSSVAVVDVASNLVLQTDGTPSGHFMPETIPRAQAYVGCSQWEYGPSAGPNQTVHGEQSYYLNYPQDFVGIPSYNSTQLFDDTVNVRLEVDENLANSQTINEVGLFLKNPNGDRGKDTPFLAAYKVISCPFTKTSEFSYIIDWEFSILDTSVPYTEQVDPSDGCTSSQ